jgi:anti-anti-sigma regulatory factor/HAMP domain-containing protein
MVTSTPVTSRFRFGIRLQIMFALGLIGALLIAVSATSLISLAHINAVIHQTVEHENQVSQLAHQISTQTLLCRRYEKDLFLNLTDAKTRADYLTKWQTTYTNLDHAITAFDTVVTTAEDHQQAATWRVAHAQYGTAMVQVEQAIASGQITTPESANAALTPSKDSIRSLTDTALATAERKASAATDARNTLDSEITTTTWLVVLIAAVALAGAVIWSLFYPTQLIRPIEALQTAAGQVAAGDLTSRAPINRHDELGVLAHSFNQMASAIEQRTHDLEIQYVQAEAARQEAETARAQIAEQLTTIEQQRTVIQEMSVPILPLTNQVLVMPLVGALDTTRLALLQAQALGAIERSAAHYLILDLTGVPVVDTQVAQGLIQVIQAARLLGAEVVVVGLRPEIAQTIVSLGIQLPHVITYSSLQSGMAYIIERTGTSPNTRP